MRTADPKKRIFVFGNKGLLGSDLMRVMGAFYFVEGTDLDEIDIRDMGRVRERLREFKPDIVINAAAYTDVDGAEKNPETAFSVNALGAKNVSAASRELGARSVYYSTDYVFGGSKNSPYSEDDPTKPVGVYARSKRDGELGVLEADPDALIIRTAWLFGLNGKNFVDTMMRLAGQKDHLDVVNDQRGAPTWTRHLAEATERLVAAGAKGIVHVTNSGETTWFDFAKRIFEGVGSKIPVMPISTAQLNRPAPRPAYSVLDLSKYERLTGHKMPTWEEALKGFLAERG